MKYCPHCGQQIRSDAVICPYCGYQQSRLSRDEQLRNNSHQINLNGQENQQENENQPGEAPVSFSKARLSTLDIITLIITVLNAGTLLFLGFQGLLRPFYISNMGIFVTVILSLAGIIALCCEVHQNNLNRLPNWSSYVALVGNVSAFVIIFMLNQKLLLISVVILIGSLWLFNYALKKTY